MTEEQEGNAAIRTPDQRLRVFVSSTLVELAEERAAVARAISALRLTPVLFELGARLHPERRTGDPAIRTGTRPCCSWDLAVRVAVS